LQVERTIIDWFRFEGDADSGEGEVMVFSVRPTAAGGGRWTTAL
jgi:hypothetical protein